MIASHQKEAARFHTMLKVVRWFEIFFALLPIKYLLKLFRFSDVFANTVALPMVALFLGTGNYTPDVPTIMLERLCTSPTYGMWYPSDKQSIVSNLPPMVVFPNFSVFYDTWRKDLEKKGVHVRLSTELTEVIRRDAKGVVVKLIKRTSVNDRHNTASAWATEGSVSNQDGDAEEVAEEYDELVLCLLTDVAKRVLGKTASFRERRILGAAKFADDITVTHNDADYMKKHYETFFDDDKAVAHLSGTDHSKRVEMAKKDFRPMYLIKCYGEDRTKLEMCFDCSNYQAQFPPQLDFERHVFQTIFLNKKRDGKLWTIDEINPDKIIRKDWWHQLCHSWTHYLFVVPWMWLLQGKKHTRFAASWTLVNAHEVACISAISAAVSLGADYPADLERDGFAFLCFRLYHLLQHGTWYRRRVTKENRNGPGAEYASGLYGSVYNGPGVKATERNMWREEREAGRSW
ncbi:hypothetical protein, variant [Verruconis gallopava]|nr:hypothetical protein, variant [Verruconis gallopava]KIW07789.1 hypothetical protein, variant [Verruconis gallopava]